MDPKDAHSWRYMIKAHGFDLEGSLQVFQQMMMEGFVPSEPTLMGILSACTGVCGLVHAMRLHACIIVSEFFLDVGVGNALISMYYKSESLGSAVGYFAAMMSHNAVTFNTVIAVLVRDSRNEEALALFQRMFLHAVCPTSVTFISILSSCAAITRLNIGKQMHAVCVYNEFLSDIALGNTLLNMYGKCDSLSDAERLFWTMPSREVVTWNCMMTSYVQHKRHEDALQLFQHMESVGTLPNNASFTNVLSACTNKTSLPDVKRLHVRVVGDRSHTDVVLGTAFVNMYSRCGSLELANKVFRNMCSSDVILWNAMIEAHVKAGRNMEAIELFSEMQATGLIPSNVTFIVLLDAFGTLEEAKYIHAVISRHSLNEDRTVGTGLLNLYSKCCSLEDVYNVFDNIRQRDTVSWNALIAAISRHSSIKDAFCSYQMMLYEGIMPNCISFINLCDACKINNASKEALWIHALILACGLEKDFYVRKSIIAMYGKVGNLEQAQGVFGEFHDHDEITSNAMITTFSLSGKSIEAMSIFRQMQIEGILPGRFTLIDLICGFVGAEMLPEGRRLHATIYNGIHEDDLTVINTLLNMYGKTGMLEEARKLFQRANKQDSYTWSVMLGAYAQCDEGKDAILIFRRMLIEAILPDRVTYVSMVSVCASQTLLVDGKQLHVSILENAFNSDVNLMNALINMYGKCGSIEEASKVFNGMQTSNIVSWNALISVYALHGKGKEALQLYHKMSKDNVVPDSVTFSTVLSACSHSGLLKEGLECFISTGKSCTFKPTSEHVTCVVDLLCRAGLLEEGEKVMKTLLMQPTSVSWTILSAFCKMHSDKDRGEQFARNALDMEPENSSLYVLLSNVIAFTTCSEKLLEIKKLES
ncbi:hypothetical protein KP509_36G017300 [Ceratopteris richardii]|nr:hypothetical protein KP509_36G017300 [Ceratopteris richardii]